MSYYSYSVIGLKIDKDKLHQKPKLEKAFPHNHPQSLKFDPQTGKKLWKEISNPIPEYNEYDDDLDCEAVGKYKLIYGTEQERCVVQLVGADDAEGRDCSNFVKMPIDEQIQEFKDFMQKLGLWDEKNFGLHSILCYL